MPYIDVKISNKLNEEEMDVLKSKLGELITLIPGKTENVLMVGINPGYNMYFAGEKREKVAYINVSLFKESGFEYKAEFTEKVFEFFEKEYGVTRENLFMSFSEYNAWGFRGKLNS